MARFEMMEGGAGGTGAAAQADVLFELGMMYATGRDCDVDVVAAHKWFNIAAIKGSERAARCARNCPRRCRRWTSPGRCAKRANG